MSSIRTVPTKQVQQVFDRHMPPELTAAILDSAEERSNGTIKGPGLFFIKVRTAINNLQSNPDFKGTQIAKGIAESDYFTNLEEDRRAAIVDEVVKLIDGSLGSEYTEQFIRGRSVVTEVLQESQESNEPMAVAS